MKTCQPPKWGIVSYWDAKLSMGRSHPMEFYSPVFAATQIAVEINISHLIYHPEIKKTCASLQSEGWPEASHAQRDFNHVGRKERFIRVKVLHLPWSCPPWVRSPPLLMSPNTTLSLLLGGLSWHGLQGLNGMQGWDGRAEGAIFGWGESLEVPHLPQAHRKPLRWHCCLCPSRQGRQRSRSPNQAHYG